MAAKRGLGRGLSALITEAPAPDETAGGASGGQRIAVKNIVKSPFQPRQSFDAESMADLVRSVSERGVVQPLLVRKKGAKYELIAGERRLRAAEQAGIEEVPAVVMKATDQQALELALIENLQREDLNVIEEAEGYKKLAAQFGMTQEKIAERVGKARASVANTMRLLELPKEVKKYVSKGELSAGHAKSLLGLQMAKEQILVAKQAISSGLSVRQLEKLVAKLTRPARKPRAMKDDVPKSHVAHLNDVLQRHLGTPVRITPSKTLANGKKAKGSIEIDIFSPDDLDRVLELLGISLDGD